MSESKIVPESDAKEQRDDKYLMVSVHNVDSNGLARKFKDPIAEESFRKNYNKYVVYKARLAFQSQLVLYVAALILESAFGDISGGALYAAIICRLAILGCCAFGYIFTRYQQSFELHADFALPMIYFAIGIILIVQYSACSQLQRHENFSPYKFHMGKWSLPNSLIYIFICFNTSGLKYFEAFMLGSIHVMAFLGVIFLLFYSENKHDFIQPTLLYLPVMLLISFLSAHDIEWQVRDGFLLKCDIGEDLQRQDALILSILPKEITQALKANRLEKL
eukprot:gene14780-31408_t